MPSSRMAATRSPEGGRCGKITLSSWSVVAGPGAVPLPPSQAAVMARTASVRCRLHKLVRAVAQVPGGVPFQRNQVRGLLRCPLVSVGFGRLSGGDVGGEPDRSHGEPEGAVGRSVWV